MSTYEIRELPAPAGSAALPSVSFLGDPNTGLYSPGADQVAISTNGTGRLFVDAIGRIQVGTSGYYDQGISGDSNFLVADTVVGHIAATTWSAANNGAYLTLGRSRSATIGTNSAVAANDELGVIAFAGDNGSSLVSRFAQISAFVDGTPGVGDNPGRLVFSTTSDNAVTPTERMRLDSSGRLGLGTSSPTALLSVRQDIGATIGNYLDLHNNSTYTGASEILIRMGRPETADRRVLLRAMGAANFTNPQFAIDVNNAERLRIDSLGRVGIGTTSPADTLQINKNATSAAAGGLTLKTADSNESLLSIGVSTSLDAAFISSLQNGSGTARPITFVVGSSSTNERMRIDTSGRLLIGTSSDVGDGSPLQVDSTAAAVASFTRYTADAARIRIGSSRGTQASRTALSNGEFGGIVQFDGYTGSAFSALARIGAACDGQAPATGDSPGRLVFSTSSDNSASPTERLRITSAGVLQVADAGNISVGTTTGTKIGTATTQKLGFYNATPVVQPTAVADATDAATAISQLNALLAHMRTLGLIAT